MNTDARFRGTLEALAAMVLLGFVSVSGDN
jgi:hypothetical protein